MRVARWPRPSRSASRKDAPHPRTMPSWPVSNGGPPDGHGRLQLIALVLLRFEHRPVFSRSACASAFSTFNRGTAGLIASRETSGKRPIADARAVEAGKAYVALVQGACLPRHSSRAI